MTYIEPKNLKTKMIFRARFYNKKTTYRDICIPGGYDLEQLASIILEAFDFEFDHNCGFYDNAAHLYRSKEIYESFVDLNTEEIGFDAVDYAKGLRDVMVKDVFTPKKSMLMYFNYKAGWAFEVICKKVIDSGLSFDDPKIIRKVGKSPVQYPYTGVEKREYFEISY